MAGFLDQPDPSRHHRAAAIAGPVDAEPPDRVGVDIEADRRPVGAQRFDQGHHRVGIAIAGRHQTAVLGPLGDGETGLAPGLALAQVVAALFAPDPVVPRQRVQPRHARQQRFDKASEHRRRQRGVGVADATLQRRDHIGVALQRSVQVLADALHFAFELGVHPVLFLLAGEHEQ